MWSDCGLGFQWGHSPGHLVMCGGELRWCGQFVCYLFW